MNLTENEVMYERLLAELRKTLIDAGVPERAIVTKVVLRTSGGRRQDADLLLVGEDGKTIVAQFEVKICPDPFRMARLTLRNMPSLHKCYVVAEVGGRTSIAAIDQSSMPQWKKLSDMPAVKELLGDYFISSSEAVSNSEENKRRIVCEELDKLYKFVAVVGLLFFSIFAIGETCGIEFSWKIYSLLFVVFVVMSVTSGCAIRVKFGDYEIAIERKDGVK